LHKVLAAAGIGSRRKCEELIAAGRVTVDGRTITEQGTKVDPDEVEIRVDGEPLRRSRKLYYLVNKPTGVVSTSRDPAGRPRVIDLLPSDERLFTVGRLDLSSEGLIVATNDGELANLLAHPRYGVEKTYHAQVAGVPEREVLDRLRQGVHLAEGFAHAKRVTVKSQHKQSALLEIVLDEGRNREVRRLLARVGHKVLRLKRVGLGPLRLGDLAPGEFRPLRREEVRALKDAAGAPGRSRLLDGTSGDVAREMQSDPIREVGAASGLTRQAGPTPHRRRPRRPTHGHRGPPR
jgi:23S rRNA pseudouridine2605 synthase